jgi:hypothetical protein
MMILSDPTAVILVTSDDQEENNEQYEATQPRRHWHRDGGR